ncbi:hypothetical protein G7046_g803 [Stylonectria norvegica]|nr:hypothetical protein G7046_g803 [Stylonectria norvegica]
MGGRQIRPARVFKTITEELNHRLLPESSIDRPPWYNIMHSVPPSESLVRTLPIRHENRPRRDRGKNIFRPQRLMYFEDRLRTTFYKDHPWELARPRVILELDGKDYQLCDWSKGLRQEGIPLTGECVVQRQLWLITNLQMDKAEAYDVTRHEFYRLRQAEEIEKRVAVEEARHVGAYFGKTRIDVAHLLENREFENWKIWAGKETARFEALRNNEVEAFGDEEGDAVVDDLAATDSAETTAKTAA